LSPPTLSGDFPVSTVHTSSSRTTERILYLQVSEAMVDLVVIPRQGMHPEFEEYRYPHAGTPNAVSDLQIVEFVPRLHDEVRGFFSDLALSCSCPRLFRMRTGHRI